MLYLGTSRWCDIGKAMVEQEKQVTFAHSISDANWSMCCLVTHHSVIKVHLLTLFLFSMLTCHLHRENLFRFPTRVPHSSREVMWRRVRGPLRREEEGPFCMRRLTTQSLLCSMRCCDTGLHRTDAETEPTLCTFNNLQTKNKR